MRRRGLVLEGAVPEQEVDDVALVGLHPVELDRLHRADVQAVDVGRIEQFPGPRLVLGQAAGDQGGADAFEHVLLLAPHDGGEREHVFGVRQARFGRGAVDNRRAEEVVPVVVHPAVAFAVLGGDFRVARVLEFVLDLVVHCLGRARDGEGGQPRFRVAHRLGGDRADPLGDGVRDLLGMPRRPDAAARRCSCARC